MKPSAWHAALAGLLHDVGKIHQRAYWGLGERKPHTAWTHQFVRGLGERGLETAEFLAHAASHHHEYRPAGWEPDDALSWAVTLADNYASQEREREEETDDPPPRVPLEPIFTRIRLPGWGEAPAGLGYSVGPIELKTAFPAPRRGLKLDYLELVKRLQKRIEALAQNGPRGLGLQTWFANLNAFLLEVAWAVPSDTRSQPDISLYDHLRLTAAFAAALWRHHEETDGEVRVERLRDEDPEKFLLVQGDLGGIQNHIYRIREAETGAGKIAKRLRARSLEVSLAAEAFAQGILDALGLTPVNRVLSAGGRFTLLVQNTEQSRRALEEARRRWQEWALDGGATLHPMLAWTSFSPAAFRDTSFGAILRASMWELAREKLRPFAYASRLFPAWATDRASLRPCPVCGMRPSRGQREDGGWEPCEACAAQEGVGASLPKKSVVWLYRKRPAPEPAFRFPGAGFSLAGAGEYLYRSRFAFTPDAVPFEVRPLTGHVPSVELARGVLGPDRDYRDWLRENDLKDVLEELGDAPERPLTFGEIARFSRGAPYLGVLMLDADRMGEVFIRGLEDRLQTPSRLGSLSRFFELFFGFIAVDLIRSPEPYLDLLGRDGKWRKISRRYPLIYGVYAGGDDVFLVGPWDALLHYALDLDGLYRRYTGGHPALTLSGGFVLVKPHTPVPLFADRAQAAEKAAKKAGRNRLAVFGQAVEWPVLEALLRRGLKFYELLEGDELPSGLGHRLLGLHALYRRWAEPGEGGEPDPEGLKYKPLLFYLRRNEGVDRHWDAFFAPLMNHEDPAMRHLPVWVQYGMYLGR